MTAMHLQAVVDVHILFVDGQGRWLFSQRCNIGDNDGEYALVAGYLEYGETLKQCAIRAAANEIGVDLQEAALEFCHVMRRGDKQVRISFFFVCHEWQGEIGDNELDACSELIWRAPHDLPQPMVEYVALALRNIRTGQSVGDLAWL